MSLHKLNPVYVLGLAVILAICSFSYELLIAKALTILIGYATVTQCLSMGVFILGLALGTLKSSRGSPKDPIASLLRVELWLSVIGASSIAMILLAHSWYRLEFQDAVIETIKGTEFIATLPIFNQARAFPLGCFLLFCFFILLLIGFLSGCEIPLLTRLLSDRNDNRESLILGASYLGTLLGSLIFLFVLIPKFDVMFTSCLLGAVNFGACLFLLRLRRSPSSLLNGVLVLAGVMVITLLVFSSEILQFNRKIFYHYNFVFVPEPVERQDLLKFTKRLPDIKTERTLYQRIDIPEFRRHGKTPGIGFFIDGHFQFDEWSEGIYHEAMVNLPLQMTDLRPETILVLGAGDGLLLRNLLREIPLSSRVIHVELDPKMLEYARDDEVLAKINLRSLDDQRVETIVGDAFQFVRSTHQKFDAVFVDFPYPFSYDLAKLYSVEFYRHIRRITQASGFAVVDIPLFQKKHLEDAPHYKDVNNVVFSTFDKAGFKTLFPFEVKEESFMLLSKEKRAFSVNHDSGGAFKEISSSQLKEIGFQKFPFVVAEKYVNSIYSPKLIYFNDPYF